MISRNSEKWKGNFRPWLRWWLGTSRNAVTVPHTASKYLIGLRFFTAGEGVCDLCVTYLKDSFERIRHS